MSFEPLAQPHGKIVGDRLIVELTGGEWDEFRCAVAFAKVSGVRYLDGPLRVFVAAGGKASISVGVDHDGTSFEAVSQLMGAVGARGAVFVVKHLGSSNPTFHPKAYLFIKHDQQGAIERALLISGSTNLTEGGLFTNHEFASAWTPDLGDPQQAAALREALAVLDAWANPATGLSAPLDTKRLVELHTLGWLPTEERIAAKRVPSGSSSGGGAPAPPAGFKKQPRPPKVQHSKRMGLPAVVLPKAFAPIGHGHRARRTAHGAATGGGAHDVLVIDIRTGTQLTELYLAKTVLREDPAFFGHPFQGWNSPRTSTAQPERDPRPIVDILLVGADGKTVSEYIEHEIRMWEYVEGSSATMDVRLGLPAELLRNLPTGCILEMRRSPVRAGLDYYLAFLTPGSTKWTAARAVATRALPSSKRCYGWL